MKTFYSAKDVEGWKRGVENMLRAFGSLPENRLRAPETIRRFSNTLNTAACIAIVEARWADALELLRRSIEAEFTFRDLLISYKSSYQDKGGYIDGLRSSSCIPLWLASVLGAGQVNLLRGKYFAQSTDLNFSEAQTSFAQRLFGVTEKRSGPVLPRLHSEEFNYDLQDMINAFYLRDMEELRRSINSACEKRLDYVKTDPGYPSAVLFFPCLGMIKLVRELWLDNFSITHQLLPLDLLDHHPNTQLKFDHPFPIDLVSW